MLAEERRARIIELLGEHKNGVVSVTELGKALGTSAMTIRRDFDYLEAAGYLRRVHGGAVASANLLEEIPFNERHVKSSDEKQEIGRLAASLVKDGETIILDAGTTTEQIARYLTQKELVVITNAMPVAEVLSHAPHITTILLGGVLKKIELCTVGSILVQNINRLTVDKMFLSVSGLSLEKGATDPDMREAEAKQAMMQSAREVILVADSQKWGVNTLMQVAPLNMIHCVVSDDGLPEAAVKNLQENGVRVLTPSMSVIV
jgi:DeoR family transcriptional regulator, fructose operon transcriptional repressor